ncbi:hypothetical protein ACF5W4_08380 [Bacillota bacterium Lsc_1132]
MSLQLQERDTWKEVLNTVKTLSDRPGLDYYRISVKREDPREEGLPSGCFHLLAQSGK